MACAKLTLRDSSEAPTFPILEPRLAAPVSRGNEAQG